MSTSDDEAARIGKAFMSRNAIRVIGAESPPAPIEARREAARVLAEARSSLVSDW